jgi:hypothetical protein
MLAHWASSFCFSFASPYMIANIGGNTFLIFMGFDIVATIFCYIFVQETRGKNLEHAAGTEWEVAERLAEAVGADEKGQAEQGVDRKEDAVVVDEKTGKALEVVAAHDTFGTNFKRKL